MPSIDPTRHEIASLHLWGLSKGHDDVQCRIVVLQEPTGVQVHEVQLRYNGSPFHERTFKSHEDAGKYSAEFLDDYLSRGWVVVPEGRPPVRH